MLVSSLAWMKIVVLYNMKKTVIIFENSISFIKYLPSRHFSKYIPLLAHIILTVLRGRFGESESLSTFPGILWVIDDKLKM